MNETRIFSRRTYCDQNEGINKQTSQICSTERGNTRTKSETQKISHLQRIFNRRWKGVDESIQVEVCETRRFTQ